MEFKITDLDSEEGLFSAIPLYGRADPKCKYRDPAHKPGVPLFADQTPPLDREFVGLAAEFKVQALPALLPTWLCIPSFIGLQIPLGNVGALMGLHGWLRLLGLPHPELHPEDSSPIAGNLFVTLLRAQPSFYQLCENAYFTGLQQTLHRHLLATRSLHRELGSGHQLFAGNPPDPLAAERAVGLDYLTLDQFARLRWRGHPLQPTNAADWLFDLEWPRPFRPIRPGQTGFAVVDRNGGSFQTFFAAEAREIKHGPKAGRLQLSGCARPKHEAIFAAYGFDANHPLTEWLSGYEVIPDRDMAYADVELLTCTVTGWGWLAWNHPWRQAVTATLQSNHKP